MVFKWVIGAAEYLPREKGEVQCFKLREYGVPIRATRDHIEQERSRDYERRARRHRRHHEHASFETVYQVHSPLSVSSPSFSYYTLL